MSARRRQTSEEHKNPGPRQLRRGWSPIQLNAHKPCILATRESSLTLATTDCLAPWLNGYTQLRHDQLVRIKLKQRCSKGPSASEPEPPHCPTTPMDVVMVACCALDWTIEPARYSVLLLPLSERITPPGKRRQPLELGCQAVRFVCCELPSSPSNVQTINCIFENDILAASYDTFSRFKTSLTSSNFQMETPLSQRADWSLTGVTANRSVHPHSLHSQTTVHSNCAYTVQLFQQHRWLLITSVILGHCC